MSFRSRCDRIYSRESRYSVARGQCVWWIKEAVYAFQATSPQRVDSKQLSRHGYLWRTKIVSQSDCHCTITSHCIIETEESIVILCRCSDICTGFAEARSVSYIHQFIEESHLHLAEIGQSEVFVWRWDEGVCSQSTVVTGVGNVIRAAYEVLCGSRQFARGESKSGRIVGLANLPT